MKDKIYNCTVPCLILLLFLSGCSTLAGIAANAFSKPEGITATAQVGKENTTSSVDGLVSTSISSGKTIRIEDAQGSAIDSGNSKEVTITNDAKTMIGLVLAGMFFPMLLIFYILPAPRWLHRRYKDI